MDAWPNYFEPSQRENSAQTNDRRREEEDGVKRTYRVPEDEVPAIEGDIEGVPLHLHGGLPH